MNENARPVDGGNIYELSTLGDIIRTYAELPAERGDLMLKELGDAVRMMAPLAGVVAVDGPLRWIDSDGGEGTLNIKTASGEPIAEIKVRLPDA